MFSLKISFFLYDDLVVSVPIEVQAYQGQSVIIIYTLAQLYIYTYKSKQNILIKCEGKRKSSSALMQEIHKVQTWPSVLHSHSYFSPHYIHIWVFYVTQWKLTVPWCFIPFSLPEMKGKCLFRWYCAFCALILFPAHISHTTNLIISDFCLVS